jgi:hypothetical protein
MAYEVKPLAKLTPDTVTPSEQFVLVQRDGQVIETRDGQKILADKHGNP